MHKVKRSHLYLAILLISFLEFTALNRISLFGVQPDLLLVVVLFFSLSLNRQRALELGLAAGLLRDLVASGFFGANIILFSIIALFVSTNSEKIYKEFFVTQIILAASAGTFLYLGHFFIGALAGETMFSRLGEGLIWVILPAVLYTSLISPLVFFALNQIFRAVKIKR